MRDQFFVSGSIYQHFVIEVAIASVEAVFDWKPYVEKVRGEGAAEAD